MSNPYQAPTYQQAAYNPYAQSAAQQQYAQSPASNPYQQGATTQQPQPTPVSSPGVDPNTPSVEFTYDPYHVNYSNLSVSQFNQIPNEQTGYSQYWDSPSSFEPEKFEENTKTETRCNDVVFLILFYIQLALSIALFVWVFLSSRKDIEEMTQIDYELDKDGTKYLYQPMLVGLAIGVVLTVIHFVYMTFAPLFYIKIGFFLGIAIAVVITIIAIIITGSFLFVIFPIISIIISLIFYCICRKHIPFSAAVLEVTCKLIVTYPSIILIEILQAIVQIVVSIFFSVLVFFILYRHFSYFFYIWVIFSFYWTTLTISFVTYMTCSGLASTWYFLNKTEYMPRYPCLNSFKRAISTSFGSAALGGLLLAIIQTLKTLVQMNGYSGSDGCVSMLICILRCIAMCILNILECCIRFITRYALIYCATFGVPFKEGCRRFAELQCNRFIDAIIGGCIISNATAYNLLTFAVGGALLGYGLGYVIFGKDNDIGPIFTCVFALMFTLCVMLMITEPVETISDTIFICFAESPENLKTSANALYELFVDKFNVDLSHYIANKD